MGCCIGKLRKGPKQLKGCHRKPDVSVDKVVIKESSLFPLSNVAYSSSANSVKSCVPSSSSSISSLKDRTFSNEFLVSCLKDNPQVVMQMNHIPYTSPPHSTLSVNKHKSADQPAFVFETRSSIGHRTQQRLEWQKPPSSHHSRRMCPISKNRDTLEYYGSTRKAAQLRSPSPSRRYKNNNGTGTKSVSRVRRVGTRQQGLPFDDRAKSSVHSTPDRRCSGNVDSAGANWKVSSSALIGEMECMSLEDVEDVDNPLISLDCFIFL